ncbi:radical SAM protein, partial [bacterium]|nr:radical SAM protein [candidate division CSSED10-310 bacterium]
MTGQHQFLEDSPSYITHIGGRAPFPTAVNIELTTRCNLRCIMCPKSAGEPRTTPDRTMDRDVFEAILRDIVPRVCRVDVVGDGEVFLAADLLEELLIGCRRLGVLVNICTNGVLMGERTARMLVEHGLADMNISLDAVRPETFEKIRGASLQRILKNIAFLNGLKDDAGTTSPRLHLSMVGMLMNIDEFPDLVRLAGDIRASSVTLQAMGEFETVRHQSVFMREPALGRKRYLEGKAIGDALGIVVGLWPESQFDEAAQDGDRPRQPTMSGIILRKDCEFPWDVPYFTTTGDVLPCCAMTPMGNLKQESFDAIWDGARYRDLRRAIRSTDPPSACVTCPGRGWYMPTIPAGRIQLGSDDRQLGLGWYKPEV